MKNKHLVAAMAVAACGLATGTAQAGDVHWSIGISLPPIGTVVSNAPVYHAPPVVYRPAPVYYQPAPVVYVPPPPRVVYQPVPVYYAPPVHYRPVPVVVYRKGHGHHHHHRDKHKHRGRDD